MPTPSKNEMEKKCRDMGRAVAEQLALVHSIFKTADEVYRIFRVQVMAEALDDGVTRPVEWIPISDH